MMVIWMEFISELERFPLKENFYSVDEFLEFLDNKISIIESDEEDIDENDYSHWAFSNIRDFVESYKKKDVDFFEYFDKIIASDWAVRFYLKCGEVLREFDLRVIDEALGGNEIMIDYDEEERKLFIKIW